MIIHKELKRFLEIIYIKNIDFKPILECELRKEFKNNEYYKLKNFCFDNNLINVNYHEMNLTVDGIELFKSLNKIKIF